MKCDGHALCVVCVACMCVCVCVCGHVGMYVYDFIRNWFVRGRLSHRAGAPPHVVHFVLTSPSGWPPSGLGGTALAHPRFPPISPRDI